MSGSGQRTPGRAKASARRKSPEEREAARKRRLEQERAAVRSRRIRRGMIAAGTVVALVLLAVVEVYVHRLNGDERRLRDDLILEARVELHVPDLVDELRGQEAALFLVVLGEDQAAELSGDPLLRDHAEWAAERLGAR